MAMNETYEGVEIVYSENTCRFEFELRGRERYAETLTKAKEAIDRPVPEEKKKGFVPTTAWKGDSYHGTGWTQVTVTSIAEKGYHSYDELWIKTNDCRKKESARYIFSFTDGNTALVSQMNSITEEIKKLEEKRQELAKNMKKFTVPAVE